MAIYHFSYAANMDIADLTHRCNMRRRSQVRFLSSEPAVLKGYRLISNVFCPSRESGILNIAPDKKSVVHGVLYESPAGDILNARDLAEGEPNTYKIHNVTVSTANGEEFPACVLMATVRRKSLFRPSQPYMDLVIKAAEHNKLPGSWIKYLESIETVPEGTSLRNALKSS